MSGKGKDDPWKPSPKGIGQPHVSFADDDEVALTQKIARPKLPRIERIVPESLNAPPTLLRPTQGGAVDASALLRARRVSSPNLVAIRSAPSEPPGMDATVARPAPLPLEAFLPAVEPVPSTVPELDHPTSLNHRSEREREREREREAESFDDVTENGPIYLPDDADVESMRASSRDVEPRSLVTRQVPADVVKILRSRAALEGAAGRDLEALKLDDGLPVESQPSPKSSRETSEALVLTKLAPTLGPIPGDPPRAPENFGSTRVSERGMPRVTAQSPSPPAVQPAAPLAPGKPSPQLQTLPLGITPADFLSGRVDAMAAAANGFASVPNGSPPNGAGASPNGVASPLPVERAPSTTGPSGEYNAVLGASGSSPSLGGGARLASSGHLAAAQPSSGAFALGGQPQPYPSGAPAQGQGMPAPPGFAGTPMPFGPAGPGAYGGMAPSGYPSPMQGFPPQGLPQGQAQNSPSQVQVPTGPGMYVGGPMTPGGTFPPGSAQAPMAQGAPFSQGNYPPQQAPPQVPSQGFAQGTFPPGSLPPGSGGAPPVDPSVGQPTGGAAGAPVAGPNSAASPPSRGKSTWVLLMLAFFVVLACGGAWLSLKGKKVPWKRSERPSLVTSLACERV